MFIHPPVDGHMGYFYLSTIVRDAAMNIHVKVFARVSVLRFGSRRGVAGSRADSTFNFLRSLQAVSHFSGTSDALLLARSHSRVQALSP